jgi:hypothetical protein
MLLPYNVGRPPRRTPVFTYTLIGINVFIYLLTVVHANILLSGEKQAWKEQKSALEQRSRNNFERNSEPGSGGTPETFPGTAPSSSSEPPPDEPGSNEDYDSGESSNESSTLSASRQQMTGDATTANDTSANDAEETVARLRKDRDIVRGTAKEHVSKDETVRAMTTVWAHTARG